MVDFTGPDAVLANIEAAVAAGVPVGRRHERLGHRRRVAAARRCAVFYAPNFAIGAVLMMRFAERGGRRTSPRAEIVELHHETKLDAAVRHSARDRGSRSAATCRSTPCGCRASSPTRRCCSAARGEVLTIRHDTTSREAFVAGRAARAGAARRAAAWAHGRPRRAALTALREETIRVGERRALAAAPGAPEALIDEEAFADDEFLPYWAELWPAAHALVGRVTGARRAARSSSSAAGSDCPSLVAAARGADGDGDRLGARRRSSSCGENAARNGLDLTRRASATGAAVARALRPRARRRRALRAAQRRAAARAACGSWRPVRSSRSPDDPTRTTFLRHVARRRRGDRRARLRLDSD